MERVEVESGHGAGSRPVRDPAEQLRALCFDFRVFSVSLFFSGCLIILRLQSISHSISESASLIQENE